MAGFLISLNVGLPASSNVVIGCPLDLVCLFVEASFRRGAVYGQKCHEYGWRIYWVGAASCIQAEGNIVKTTARKVKFRRRGFLMSKTFRKLT